MDRSDVDQAELGSRVARELEIVGDRREMRVAGIRISGRRRRPSGGRAPMPRRLHRSGRLFLLSALVAVAIWALLFAVPSTTQFWEQLDQTMLDRFVDLRSASRTALAEAVTVLGAAWFNRILRLGSLLALAFVRRWRHFFGFLIAVLLVEASVSILQAAIGRPRPFVEIIGDWHGASHPSEPVAAFGVTIVAMAYTLVPKGRVRSGLFWAGGVAILALACANVYLGVDHPTDTLVSASFAPAVGVIVFRWFAPESLFPVTWARGVKAHLDVGGARGEAIRIAMAEQLGIEVLDIELFGAEGSGGSTPLRLRVEGDPDTHLFAKLYSQTHLRSDRWYKVGRTILYGSLEDEVRFTSVRRLVEYEDYIQRLMRDSGVASARPFGIVEVSPEREYLMVSEFLDGATELTTADVDDHIIDEALGLIRAMWDAGLAHRDIKPANVMIRNGSVVLIDVAFGTVRPSPWRQAVDLANMMVILALRAGSSRVYERALLQFAPEDIGEAFAATRSVTLPSQSRSSLALLKKERGIDLVDEFRALAPRTEPISIQRWSPRRIALTLAAVTVFAILGLELFAEFTGKGAL